jgi:hypothetical protein
MATGGESQGDIAIAQTFERRKRFSPRRWSGISSVPSISNAASLAIFCSQIVVDFACVAVLPEIYGSNSE